MGGARGGSTPKATGILEFRGLAEIGLIAMPDRPGLAGTVLDCLSKRGLNTPFVVELTDPNGTSHIALCVREPDLEQALEAVGALADQLHAQRVVQRRGVAVAAVHGPHFRERPGCAAAACAAIAGKGVNILAISTSLSSIACMVDAADLAATVRSLQTTFDLPDQAVMVAGEGLTSPVRTGC
ncbi:MAG TPA: ACT domain-containing protein [Thermoanaerobaculaceae bacterium]|nr:ACT domain-containing protein [Thermoanaerobaculaceae bacterium]